MPGEFARRRHLQRGWAFLKTEMNEFVDLLPAQQRNDNESWYRGTADAVYQNHDILESYGADYIVVQAPQSPSNWKSPAEGIDTYDDHRMAMCFSLAAFGPNALQINDPNCVAKTFPTYFAEFAKIVS